MIWNLYLAHITGDFILQTEWMVRNRDKFWVLTLHASTHLMLMLVLIGKARSEYWTLLSMIAVIHLVQDAVKVHLTSRHPEWTVGAFILDQVLHVVIIWIFFSVFQIGGGTIITTQQTILVVIGISFVFVTYFWVVAEKVVNHSNTEFIQYVDQTKYSRSLMRIGLVSAYLLFRTWYAPGLALLLPNPYSSSRFSQRALVTDLVVSVVVMIFLFWTLG